MKIGLHLSSFSWPSGTPGLARDLTRIARVAEANDFHALSVMDHVWQVGHNGGPEQAMLEAYTTLGYLAASTSRIQLSAWVTAAVYREPGLLAKAVTTLDVLSEGRAWLGIGAGWYEQEAHGLGLPFPPLAQRFERLEEALQICLQMWGDDDGPYEGTHYRLSKTLNAPQSLTRPHPPILIGGGGEKKTLRLVAQYAQACNLFAGPDVPRKLDVLRAHCDAMGRDYDDIEKTVSGPLDPGRHGEHVDALIRRMADLSQLGVTHYHGSVPDVAAITSLETIGRRVIPAVYDLANTQRPSPPPTTTVCPR